MLKTDSNNSTLVCQFENSMAEFTVSSPQGLAQVMHCMLTIFVHNGALAALKEHSKVVSQMLIHRPFTHQQSCCKPTNVSLSLDARSGKEFIFNRSYYAGCYRSYSMKRIVWFQLLSLLGTPCGLANSTVPLCFSVIENEKTSASDQ
jgi:hypothetical protein